MQDSSSSGFTLIEISIVLVIIGLVVGGVFVGQDLIHAAKARAQITQLEKFNQAVNTFYGKYGALPGDMNAGVALQYGFTPRGSDPGQGDGNGMIQVNGCGSCQGSDWGSGIPTGETAMFWSDLTYANGMNINLIEGSFSSASPISGPIGGSYSGSGISLFFPEAKIGGGNYITVYHAHTVSGNFPQGNYYGISVIQSIQFNGGGSTNVIGPGLTVSQAYDIDRKMDDGLPMSGNVQIVYNQSGDQACTAGFGTCAYPYNGYPLSFIGSISPSSTTCADNGGNANNPAVYSTSAAAGNGNAINCALSIKMQGGD